MIMRLIEFLPVVLLQEEFFWLIRSRESVIVTWTGFLTVQFCEFKVTSRLYLFYTQKWYNQYQLTNRMSGTGAVGMIIDSMMGCAETYHC